VLDGSVTGAARAAVILNAGAAIYVSGQADSLAVGVEAARHALDSGAGTDALERLRSATRRART
jgi:anthranilate phosphoribosyltransferase